MSGTGTAVSSTVTWLGTQFTQLGIFFGETFEIFLGNIRMGVESIFGLNVAIGQTLTLGERVFAISSTLTTLSLTIFGISSATNVVLKLFKAFVSQRPNSIIGRLAALINTTFIRPFGKDFSVTVQELQIR